LQQGTSRTGVGSVTALSEQFMHGCRGSKKKNAVATYEKQWQRCWGVTHHWAPVPGKALEQIMKVC